MKLFILLYFILFSNYAVSQKIKPSDDKFINLTSNKNEDQKTSNSKEKEKITKKSRDDEIKKIKPVTIGKLGMPSLGSIGVETSLNKKIGLNLWSEFTANDAIKYLNSLPDSSSSRSFQKLLNEVYASTSEPPKGSPEEISKFLNTKLAKLASNGQIDYLIKIIDQLPNSRKWERWKKWYVLHHFLIKDDENACQKISNSTNNYDSIFWKKANLLCLILQRNLSEANFIYDVMISQNLLDNTFEILIDKILNEKQLDKIELKEKTITPLNLILLDIVKYPISFDMIKDFGFEYKSQLLDLIYLKPEARAMLVDQMTIVKHVKTDLLIKIYQDIEFNNLNQDENLKNLTVNPNGLNRANILINSMKIKDSSEKAEFIFKNLLIESKHDNSEIASAIYIPTLNSLKTKSLSQSQVKIINYLYNLNNPEEFINDPYSKILLNPENEVWDIGFISQHNAWNIHNYLKYLGMKTPDLSWENNFDFSSNKIKMLNKKFSLNVSNKEFILSKAIENNISEKNYLKAIILIGKLIDKKELKYLNLTTLKDIDKYLKKLDFLTLRNEFRKEILYKKFFYFKNLYNEF